MGDYEALYKQSLVQIQKQKDQIRKLEQEIRQRCQSYLIHSSQFRSSQNSAKKQNLTNSRAESQPEPNPTQTPPFNAVDPKTETDENAGSPVSNEEGPADFQDHTQSGLPVEENVDIQETGVGEGLVNQETTSNLDESRKASIKQEKEQVNWEQIVSGLKQRLSAIQKQKSEQVQKVLDLQVQIRELKKEKASTEAVNGSMKKKSTRSAEYNINEEIAAQIAQTLDSFQDSSIFEDCSNMSDQVQKLVNYASEMKKKVAYFEEKYPKKLEESKVSSYHFNTPYRKIDFKGMDQEEQIRDHYEEHQLEMLRNKCKILESELSKSRSNREDSQEKRPQVHQSSQDEVQEEVERQQICNDGSYIIEEELSKPNSPYVKRSFVRKKVVKRNLSAMILRSSSKSKQESKASMLSQLQRLKGHLSKSKDGTNDKEVLSLSRKIDKIQKRIEEKETKIDEISDEDSRASGASHGFTEIIQIETEGPGYKNYTAHIMGMKTKDRSIQFAQ